MPVIVVGREDSVPDPDRLTFQETTMKNPSELSRAELESIAERVRDILWRDIDTREFDPGREWSIETIEWVADVLEDAGLRPPDRGDSEAVAADDPSQPVSQDPARHDHEPSPVAALRSALDALIDTIEATGGCVRDEDGHVAPEGDPDWIDLGDAYVLACTAIGRTPRIVETQEEIEEI
jgi:hypothetical protein